MDSETAKRFINELLTSTSKTACLVKLSCNSKDELLEPLMYYFHERGDDELKRAFIAEVSTIDSREAIPALVSLMIAVDDLICGCGKAPYEFAFRNAIINALTCNSRAVAESLISGTSASDSQQRFDATTAMVKLEFHVKPSIFHEIEVIAAIIHRLAHDPVPAVRKGALIAIRAFARRMGADDLLDMQHILLAALQDTNREVQMAAAETIAYPTKLRLMLIEPIRSLLSDREQDARLAGLVTLEGIDDPAVALALLQFIQNEETELKPFAETVLHGKAKMPQVKQGLLEALHHTDSTIRKLAAQHLVWSLETKEIEPLIEMLDDPDEHICWQAAESLGRITDQHFLLDKQRWLTWLEEYTANK